MGVFEDKLRTNETFDSLIALYRRSLQESWSLHERVSELEILEGALLRRIDQQHEQIHKLLTEREATTGEKDT